MGNKRGKRKQQQQQQQQQQPAAAKSSTANHSNGSDVIAQAEAKSASLSSSACVEQRLPPHPSCAGKSLNGDVAMEAAGSLEAKEEDSGGGGMRCRHIGRGVNVEKLQEKLQKSEVDRCQDCDKGDGGDGGRERKGKAKKVVKKKAQLNRSKSGAAASSGGGDYREGAVMVCLACAHVGCATSGRNGKEEEEEEENEEEELEVGLGHARQHYLQWKHPIALHRRNENSSVWCFQCRSILRYDLAASNSAEENGNHASVSSRVSILQEAVGLVHDRLAKQAAMVDNQPQIERPIVSSPSEAFLSHEPRKDRCMIRGLMNLGNTCFFNSVLQNLLALDLLRDHFCKVESKREGFLTAALRRFYRDFYACGSESTKDYNFGEINARSSRKQSTTDHNIGSTLSPKVLFGAICTKASRFKGYQQQDSHELLRFLLDGLQTEEQAEISKADLQHGGFASADRRFSISDNEQTESQDDPKEEPSNECPGKGVSTAETFVERMFKGKYSSTVSCCECSHSSVVYESFLDLSLPLPTKPAQKKAVTSKGGSSFQTKLSSSSTRSSRPQISKDIKRRNNSMASFSESSKVTEAAKELSTSPASINSSDRVSEKSPTSTNGISCPPQSNNPADDFTWIDYINFEESDSSKRTEEPSNISSDYVAISSGDVTPELVPLISSDLTLLDQQSVQNSTFTGSELVADSSIAPAVISSNHAEISEELPKASLPEVILLPYWSTDHAPTMLDTHEEREPPDGSSLETYAFHQNPRQETSHTHKSLRDSTIPAMEYCDSGTDFEGLTELFDEGTSYECVPLSLDCDTEERPAVEIVDNENGGEVGNNKDKSQKNQQREAQIGKIAEFMSLEKCLEIFTSSELLSGENAWGCDHCSRAQAVAMINTSNGRSTEVHRKSQGVALKSHFSHKTAVPVKASVAPTSMTGAKTCAASGVAGQVRNFADRSPAIHLCSCNGTVPSTSASSVQNGTISCTGYLIGGSSDNGHIQGHVVVKEGIACREITSKALESISGSSKEEQFSLECKSMLLESSEKVSTKADVSCQDQSEIGQGLPLGVPHFVIEAEANESAEVLQQRISKLQLGDRDVTVSEKDLLLSEAKENELVLERETEALHKSRNDSSSFRATRLSKRALKSQKSLADKPKPGAENIVKRNATKRILISKAPPILTVHLKRFAQDNHGRLSKLSGHIAFPERLDLSPFLDSRCSSSESWIYCLVGIVEHTGSMKGGHYVAYVRGKTIVNDVHGTKRADFFQENVWYYISDSHVYRTTIESVLKSEAYLLFYERIHRKPL